MANNIETLKKYVIDVEVSTQRATAELDKLQKKVDKGVNSGQIKKDTQASINQIEGMIKELSNSIAKESESIKNGLKNGLSGIKTKDLEEKFAAVDKSINGVIDKINLLSSTLNSSDFAKFERFVDAFTVPLQDLNKTVAELNTTLTALTEPLQTISKMKVGAIDTKAFEQSVKKLEPMTEEVRRKVEKTLTGFRNTLKKNLYGEGVDADELLEVDEITAAAARKSKIAIKGILEELDKIKKSYSDNIGELLSKTGIDLDEQALSGLYDALAKQLGESVRQGKNFKKKDAITMRVTPVAKVTDEEIDNVVKEIATNISKKVTNKLKENEGTKIKVPIKGDTTGLKKEIESQIKTFNNTAKTDPSLQVDVPIKAFIDENSMKMLRSRLQSEINEGDGLTLNGTTNITGVEGIASDVSAIRELLSNGIPITSIGSGGGSVSQSEGSTARVQGLKGYEWIFDNQLKDAGAQRRRAIDEANQELAKEAEQYFKNIIDSITAFVTGKSTKNPLDLLEKNPLYTATVDNGKYAKYGDKGQTTEEWQSEIKKIITDTIDAIKTESGEIESNFTKLKKTISAVVDQADSGTIKTKSGTYKIHNAVQKEDPFKEVQRVAMDEINAQKKAATTESSLKNWLKDSKNAKDVEKYREEQEKIRTNQIRALEVELEQVRKKSEIEKQILSENDDINNLKKTDLKQYEKVKGSTRRVGEINEQLNQLKNSPLYSTEDVDKEVKTLQNRLSSLQQEVDAEKQILSKNEELAKVEDLNRQLRNINERIANETSGEKEAALIKKQIETQKERDEVLSKMPKDLLDKYNKVQNLIDEITNVSQRISSLKSNTVISDEDIAKKIIEEPLNAALSRVSASTKMTTEIAEWLDLAMERAISQVVDKYRITDASELYTRRKWYGSRANEIQKGISSSGNEVLSKTLEEELRVFSNKLDNSSYRELIQIFSNLLDYGTSFNKAGKIVNSMADEVDKANAVYQFMKQIDVQTETTLEKYENQRRVLENIKQLQADTSKDHTDEINSLMADDITQKLMTDKNGVVRSVDDAFTELDKIINIIVRNANMAKKELATTVYSSIGSERNYNYKKDRYLSEVSELQRLSGYDSSGYALTGTERDRYETLKKSVKILREEISAYEDINNIEDRVVMSARARQFEESETKETLSEEAEMLKRADYAVYGFSEEGKNAYNETSKIGKSFYSESSTEEVTKAHLKHQIVIDDLTKSIQKYGVYELEEQAQARERIKILESEMLTLKEGTEEYKQRDTELKSLTQTLEKYKETEVNTIEKMANDEAKAQIQERIKLHEQEIQKIKEKIERETERSAKSNGKYNYNPQWDNKKIEDIQKDIDYLRSGTAAANKELESKRKELDKINEEIKNFETKTMNSFGIKDSKQAEGLIEYFVRLDKYLDETRDKMKDLQSQRKSLQDTSSKGKTPEQINTVRSELKEVNAEIEKIQDGYSKLHNELVQYAKDNGIKLTKILGTDKFGIDNGRLNLSDNISKYMSKIEARNKLQRRIDQLSGMYEDENGNTISYEERTRKRILDLRTRERDLILSTLQTETEKKNLAEQEIRRREQEVAERDRILHIDIDKERQNADKEFEKTSAKIDRQLEKEKEKRDKLAARIDDVNEKHKESIELARQELALREKELQTAQTKAQKFANSTLDTLVSNSNVKNPNKQSSRNKVRDNRENQLSVLNEEVNQAQKLVDEAKKQLGIQEQLLEKDLNRYNLMTRLGEADQKITSLEVQQKANSENNNARQAELDALAKQQEMLENQVELEEKDLAIKVAKSEEVQKREQYRKDLEAELELLALDKQIQKVEEEIKTASKDNLDYLNLKLQGLKQEYVQQLNILEAQKKQKENAKDRPVNQELEAKKIEHMATIRDKNGNINKTIALGDIATETTLRQILTVVSGGKVPTPGVTGDKSKGGIQLSDEYKNTLKGLKGLKAGGDLNEFLKKLFTQFPAEAFSQYRLRQNKDGNLTYLNLNRKKATEEDHAFTAKKLAEWGITEDQLIQATKESTNAEKKHSKAASDLSDEQENERKTAWAAIRKLKGDKGGKDTSNNEALANLFKENSNYLNYYGFKENEFGKYRAIKAENLSDADIKLMESLGISLENIAKKAEQATAATRDYTNATKEQLETWFNEGDVENVVNELDRRKKQTENNTQATQKSTQATREETAAARENAQALTEEGKAAEEAGKKKEKASSKKTKGLTSEETIQNASIAQISQTVADAKGKLAKAEAAMAIHGEEAAKQYINSPKKFKKENYNAWVDFAEAGVKATKDTLGISSPSKVFEQLGFWVDQGLAIGILENADLVKNAIINMLKQGVVTPKQIQELLGWNKDDGTLTGKKGKSVIRKNSKLYGSFQGGVQSALDTDSSLTSYLNKDNLKEVYSTLEKCLVARRKLIDEGKESLEYDQRILEINKLLSETLVDTQKYKGIENRNILKMYGEQQTYLKQDAEGNVHTVGHFSFDEQLLDGRIQRVFVDFNEQTQEWEERLFRVETNFKKIEDRIMALDKEYAKAVNKNDQNKIDSIGLERDKYVSLLQFYSQSKEFAYDISQFEEKRKQAAKELVNIYNEQNRVEADKIRNKEQEESAKRVASLQKEQLTTWREIKDISEQMARLNIQTSQGDKLKYDDLEHQKKSLIEILNQKTRELKINDENFNIEKNRADLAAVTAEVKNKYAISDAYKMDAETAKAEAARIREEEKLRREEEKKRVASERETTREIANLTKQQIKAYEELWDVRKKIATLDPSKDANQIAALRDLENARKYVFSGITSSLSALDPSGTRNRTKNLFAIGKDYNSQIDVIKGRQTDIKERELLSQLNQAWKEVIVSKQRYYDLSRKDNVSSNQLADEKKKADEAVNIFEKLKAQYNKTFVPSDDPLKKFYDHILKDTNNMINKYKQDLTKINPTEFINIITELQNLPSTLSAGTPDAIQGIIDKVVELQNRLTTLAGVIDSDSKGKFNIGEKLLGKMGNAGFLNNKIPLFSNELSSIKTQWDNLWNNWKGTQDQKNQLNELIERLQVLNSTASQYKDTMGKMKFVDINPGQIDDIYKLQDAMTQYATSLGYSNIAFQKFDENQDHLVMTAKNANGEMVQLSGAINRVNNSMYASQPVMKQSISFWGSMGTSLKQAFSTFGYYLGFAALIRKTMQQFRQGISTLKEFDSALTTISYTMKLSQKELKDLGNSALDMAEDLSMSMENALKIYQIYANMQTTAEEIQEVARPTAILSNLSGVDASTAADQVQGILQQFNMLKDGEEDVAETSMHVVDVLDKISANVAVDYAKLFGAYIRNNIMKNKPKSVKTKLILFSFIKEILYGKIYKIQNKINNKVYIGQTILEDVIKHRYGGNLLNTHNEHLKNSIIKYGKENFEVEIIDYADDKDELNKKEVYWIKKYNSYHNGYNETPGGQYGTQTEETIKKISIASKRYWDNHPEERINRSNKNLGDNNFLVLKGGHTEADKEKMRRIRLEMMQRDDNNIDIQKARLISLLPENKRKQVISSSKYWYYIYDLDMDELAKYHTIKDVYDFLVNHNYDPLYKNYRSFKQPSVQNKVFNKDLYKDEYGLIIKKVKKTSKERKQIKTEFRKERENKLAC